MIKGKSILITASLIAFILGLMYIVAGSLCLYNWIMTSLINGEAILEQLVPPDPWLSIVLISIGLTYSSSAYYLMRGNTVLSIASILVGGGLAIIVMGLQVLATLAYIADKLIINEELRFSTIIGNLLRIDGILGYVSLIPFLLGYRFYKEMKD